MTPSKECEATNWDKIIIKTQVTKDYYMKYTKHF